MNDRLQELLRQRQLMQEHLAWLDGEIAAASGVYAIENSARKTAGPPVHSTEAVHATPSTTAPSAGGLRAPELDPLLADYHQEPDTLVTDTKRGCLIYFCVGMAVMLVAVFLFYLHYYHRRPPVSPSPTTAISLPKH